MIGFNRLTLRWHLIGGYDRLFGQSLSVSSADDFRNLTRSRIFEFLRDARPMNPPETATDATRRLEMRLGDFGIPRKFIDEITGHHTVVNYNKGSMVFLQGSPADSHVLGPRRPGQGLLSGGPMEPVSWLGSLVWGILSVPLITSIRGAATPRSPRPRH